MRFRLLSACLLLSTALAAGLPRLDQGRMDPAWFGSDLTFERSTLVQFLWVKPGLSLRGRTLHLRPWEAPAWLVKPRPEKDQAFLRRLEPILVPGLLEALQDGLGEALPVAMGTGDLVLTGRITDARADGVGGMFGGLGGIYFDLKLTEAVSGELLLAAHHAIEGERAESIQARYQAWCGTLARILAERALPTAVPRALPPLRPVAPAAASVTPSVELEATLRRLEGLRRDGLLTEEEFQVLRRQAVEKAKSPR